MIGDVKVEYGDDIAYIRLGSGKVAKAREVASGVVLDLDENDEAVGLEVPGLRSRGLRQGEVTAERLRPESGPDGDAVEQELAERLFGPRPRKNSRS